MEQGAAEPAVAPRGGTALAAPDAPLTDGNGLGVDTAPTHAQRAKPKRFRRATGTLKRWTPEEDEHLKLLMEEARLPRPKRKDFDELARLLGTERTGYAVEQHWNLYLSTSAKKPKPEEAQSTDTPPAADAGAGAGASEAVGSDGGGAALAPAAPEAAEEAPVEVVSEVAGEAASEPASAPAIEAAIRAAEDREVRLAISGASAGVSSEGSSAGGNGADSHGGSLQPA